MIVLGIILALIGFFTGLSILTTVGIILVVVGAVLSILGATGRAVGRTKSLVLITTARVAEKAVPDLFGDRVPLFVLQLVFGLSTPNYRSERHRVNMKDAFSRP